VNLASEFLPEGKLVVKQENSNGNFQEYKVDRPGRLLKIPLMVLVNKGSASASEILAGALRDWERTQIVGEKTFGKGTVQEALDLREGAGLHVTVAKWILPKGEWVHKNGIKPDMEIALDDKEATRDAQLEKAAEMLLK
jgi:carboxyl-terminal processing protease